MVWVTLNHNVSVQVCISLTYGQITILKIEEMTWNSFEGCFLCDWNKPISYWYVFMKYNHEFMSYALSKSTPEKLKRRSSWLEHFTDRLSFCRICVSYRYIECRNCKVRVLYLWVCVCYICQVCVLYFANSCVIFAIFTCYICEFCVFYLRIPCVIFGN